MTTKLTKTLTTYLDKLKLFRAFSSAQALLSWDRETCMPTGAVGDRGFAMSTIAGFGHQLFTEKSFVKVVADLYEHRDELLPLERRSITVTHRELQKSLKLSKEFVEESNLIVNAAHAAWLEAKETNNFALFQPHLEKVVDNRRRYAEFLKPGADPYDVCLDDYEEGLTTHHLKPVFTELRQGLVKLLPEILKKQTKVINPLNQIAVEPLVIEKFLKEMVSIVGFDLKRGALGSVEHPFEISISLNDVRLNTHYSPTEHAFTITGMVHEMGHGLYEQNIDPKYVDYSLASGVSLGIHESQSRLLENMIGRSRQFWSYFLPKLQAHSPAFKNIELDQLVKALNYVEPSLIRTEADEVTYNLHIILRFELEIELMHGRLAVKDVTEAWQNKMSELLGVIPATDREGVLQDVHWSWGNFGYFPTYSLGNLNAAQLYDSFCKTHPDCLDRIAQGDFEPYFSWFKEHVWQHGSFYTPEEIMVKATGQSTQPAFLLSYLREKYLA